MIVFTLCSSIVAFFLSKRVRKGVNRRFFYVIIGIMIFNILFGLTTNDVNVRESVTLLPIPVLVFSLGYLFWTRKDTRVK